MINYIPNDPLAQTALPIRQQPPRPNRPANRAGFEFVSPAPAENAFAPGTQEFLFWQSREAALAAVETWETIDAPLTQWAPQVPNRRRLPLLPNEGDQLNAFYNGANLSFFEHSDGGKTTFSGASTEVVAHETGHALLDSVRPDLWGSPFPEISAFHEAFGDCMALLTALSDEATRRKLLQDSPSLGDANFVEAVMEDLSDGVRRAPVPLGPQHNASVPRRLLNDFNWAIPSTLPMAGRPNVLTSEVHSFGQVFGGCFYDVVRNIFAGSAKKDDGALVLAAQTAGRILVAAARQAPDNVRFFQSIGRAMVLADGTLNNGANRDAIRDAFTRHNIALGTNAMLAPRGALNGPPPKLTSRGTGAVLSAETVRDIKRRMDVPSGGKLAVDVLQLGGEKVARALHVRAVPLQSVAKELKGVVALVPEHLLVGSIERSAAMVSAIPEPYTSDDEVQHFVATLLAHGQLLPEVAVAARALRGAVAGEAAPVPLPTHRVVTRRGRKVLERVRFACGSHQVGCCCFRH